MSIQEKPLPNLKDARFELKEDVSTFTEQSLPKLCNRLGAITPAFKDIVARFGYPPFWTRPNTLASIVWIILEQQVSLASAKAAYLKLETLTGGITADALLRMTDLQFKECYFSRQKTVYARALAQAVTDGQLDLQTLPDLPDIEVRKVLCSVKGIGNWTTDVYLLFVLHRTDIFPTGDLAMVKAMKELLQLDPTIAPVELINHAKQWRPYRSIATMLFWQYYLGVRNRKA